MAHIGPFEHEQAIIKERERRVNWTMKQLDERVQKVNDSLAAALRAIPALKPAQLNADFARMSGDNAVASVSCETGIEDIAVFLSIHLLWPLSRDGIQMNSPTVGPLHISAARRGHRTPGAYNFSNHGSWGIDPTTLKHKIDEAIKKLPSRR